MEKSAGGRGIKAGGIKKDRSVLPGGLFLYVKLEIIFV